MPRISHWHVGALKLGESRTPLGRIRGWKPSNPPHAPRWGVGLTLTSAYTWCIWKYVFWVSIREKLWKKIYANQVLPAAVERRNKVVHLRLIMQVVPLRLIMRLIMQNIIAHAMHIIFLKGKLLPREGRPNMRCLLVMKRPFEGSWNTSTRLFCLKICQLLI